MVKFREFLTLLFFLDYNDVTSGMTVTEVTLFPSYLQGIISHTSQEVSFNLSCLSCNKTMSWNFQIWTSHQEIALVTTSTHESKQDGSENICEGNFTLLGRQIGRTNLNFHINISDYGQTMENKTDLMPVSVIRTPSMINTVFNISLAVWLVINYILFGCGFEMTLLKSTLRRPVAPVILFICQCVCLPVLGFAFSLLLPHMLGFGLFLVGTCPGGGASNVWTVLLGGDLTLSMCLTVLSTFAALGMMPLWLYTLGQHILQDAVSIPFKDIIIALVLLIVPLMVGLGIRHFLPRVGHFLLRLVRPLSFLYMVFLLTLGVYANLYAFTFMKDWRVIVASAGLPWGGMIIALVFSKVARETQQRVLTIAIETAIQNGAIALVVLRNLLPQPEADLTSVMVISTTILTPIPLIIGYIIVIFRACQRGDQEAICGMLKTRAQENEKEEEEHTTATTLDDITTTSR